MATMSAVAQPTLHGETSAPEPVRRRKSSFPPTQRVRPPPMGHPGDTADRVPLKPNKLRRRESRGGIRGIFARNKSDKDVVAAVREALSTREAPEEAVADKNLPHPSFKRDATVPAQPPVTPPTPPVASKQARMSLRPKSITPRRPSPKQSPKANAKSSPRPTRTSAAWDPPPLFQAYPQAIKHATLAAPTLSVEAILRMSNHNARNSFRDEIAQTAPDETDPTAAAKRAARAKNKHRRQISGSISKADWTQKIFVLVTSGHLLQYAGEGSFDRLPEKIMQLNKDSVAFASDVIPGKHWVLQISQSMNADGTPTADTRSLLSRMTFRGADYRRTATSLLLVLNSAEDLDSWIAVVRREIEALGGKKHVSETGKPKPDDRVMEMTGKTSHRFLIQRSLDQNASPASPSSPAFAPPPWANDDQLQDDIADTASIIARPVSTLRPSTGHQSVANSVMSHDGRQLESLRDSGNRLSYMSSGQRTLITSHSSSSTSSPARESYPSYEDLPPPLAGEDARLGPHATAIDERRRSMQTLRTAAREVSPQPSNHRHSTFATPSRPFGSHSPPPNFSTPKRTSRILIPETRPMLTVVTPSSTPGNRRDSILKGTRKGPPAALHVVRPLSPLKDSPPPGKHAPPALTPRQLGLRVEKLVFSMTQRSQSAPSTPTSPVDLPPQPPSLMPVDSGETAHREFQSPEQFSRMQALRDAFDFAPEAPIRPASIPPAARETPFPSSPYRDQHELALARNHSIEATTLANSKQKLRRPISMQIRPRPTSPPTSTNSRKPPLSGRNQRQISLGMTATSPASWTSLSPSFQHLKVEAHPKSVESRRSMPLLVNGPPLAPPPACALPPLPLGSAGMRSPLGLRNSLPV